MYNTQMATTSGNRQCITGSTHVWARNLLCSLSVASEAKSWKRQKMLRDRLKLLKTTESGSHRLARTNEAGVEVAKSLSQRYEDDEKEFCYYPNRGEPKCELAGDVDGDCG